MGPSRQAVWPVRLQAALAARAEAVGLCRVAWAPRLRLEASVGFSLGCFPSQGEAEVVAVVVAQLDECMRYVKDELSQKAERETSRQKAAAGKRR